MAVCTASEMVSALKRVNVANKSGIEMFCVLLTACAFFFFFILKSSGPVVFGNGFVKKSSDFSSSKSCWFTVPVLAISAS